MTSDHSGGGRPAPESWDQWQYPGLDEPELLTRTELLATLDRLGLSVTERQLRFWEAEGVLPAPVRRRRAGATRALYPVWCVNLVFALRHFQERGYALNELPERMRLAARYFSYAEEAYGHPTEQRWRAEPPPIFPFESQSEDWFDYKLRPALTQLLTPYAESFLKFEGSRFVRADLILVDEHGKALKFSIPLPTTPHPPTPEGP